MNEAILRMVQKMIAPLQRRIMNMICRGIVETINNTGGIQLVKGSLLQDEILDGMEFVGNYGFSSVAPPGSQMIVAFWGGDRSHPLVLAVNDATSRKKDLLPGDSALYTQTGSYIWLQQTGEEISIFVPPGLGKIRLEADDIEICARAKIKWDVDGRGYDYLPTQTAYFETGSSAPTLAPIAPPEHP